MGVRCRKCGVREADVVDDTYDHVGNDEDFPRGLPVFRPANPSSHPSSTIIGGETQADLDVDPLATVIKNAVIANVGGAGFYDDVVDMIDGENMNCPSYDEACVKEVKCSLLE